MSRKPRSVEGAKRQSGLVVLGTALFILGVAMLVAPDPMSGPGVDRGPIVDALWSRPSGLVALVVGVALLLMLLRPKKRGPMA